MRKILVTGGAGFIGSHLIEKLVKKGYQVKTIVPYNIENSWGWIDTFDNNIKKNIEVVSGDICDQNIVLKTVKNIDVLFHLAALISIPYSYVSPRSYISTNILGTFNFLEAIKNSKVELFVQTSSSEVYGNSQYLPIDEKHPLNAQSPYSASKIAADQLCLSYWRSFSLPIVIMRPFNTFGPRQSLRAVIPTMILQTIKNNKYIKLGNLSTKRDFSYISDTVEGLESCIGNKKCIGEVINLGNGFDLSMKKALEIIQLKLGKKLTVKIEKKRLRPKKSEVNQLLSSNIKARKILKWKPKFSNLNGFKRGLENTIEWFNKSENIKYYKSNIYNF
tara:strand:+ start:1564 stop:2562 length:999 start_codon:yes stop_codon:yes gene_type:complete